MLKRLLLSGAALTAFVGIAAAQSASTPADPAAPPAAEAPAAPGGSAAATTEAQKSDPDLFSNIKGADVVGQNDESVGNLADVLIDTSGQIKSLVISHGGIVGIGKSYRQYEVGELPAMADGKVRIGELNTAALEGIPEYHYPEASTGRAATEGAAPSDPNASSSMSASPGASAAAGGELQPVSYLVGAHVGNEQDKAKISDIRFEGNQAKAVLIDRGSLGLGNKVEEIAFADIAISGSPAEPKVSMKSGSAGGSMSEPAAPAPMAPASPSAPSPSAAP
jgi:PRC-barrel domain